MITGEMVKADRAARKLSMSAYAELVGLTPAKINNIEKKRDPKPDELEKLAQFIQAAPVVAGASVVEPPPGEPSPPPSEGVPAQQQEIFALSDEELEEDIAATDEQMLIVMVNQRDWRSSCPTCNTEFIRTSQETIIDWMRTHVPQCTGQPMEGVLVGSPLEPAAEDVTAQADATPHPFDPDTGIRRVSHGEFATFKRCKRKWYLAYYRELGLPVEVKVGAAPLGTMVHKALQAWYVPEGQTPGNPYEVLETIIRADVEALSADPTALAEYVKQAELARAMVEGYFQWLQETGADEGIRIIASETKLEVESGIENVRLIGKLDVRAVREVDQARLVIDHKTVGSFLDASKWLHMREQPLHYLLLEYLDLRAAGLEHERCIGAIWNMLRKVLRTERAKPPFYDRAEVRHNMYSLQSYWTHLMAGLQAIEQVRQTLNAAWDHHAVAYPTPHRDCIWDCDFFHVCSMMDDGSYAEEFMSANLVHINPLKRYEPEGVAD